MNSSEIVEKIRAEFHQRVGISQKRPGLFQLVAPFYHEDGDMYDIFIEDTEDGSSARITDKGLTLMRLSYSFAIDTPRKEKIFEQILREHEIRQDDGELYTVAPPDSLYETVLRFSRAVTAVSNMALYRRDVVRSLFYELFAEFVSDDLGSFQPEAHHLPLPDRDDLEVDFVIPTRHKPLFLFGVKDESKAKLVAISCLEFLRNDIPFRSVAVHENFESLTAKDRRIITNVVDKQFTDLADFQNSGADYLKREVA